MTRSQRKSSVKLKTYIEFSVILVQHFPDINDVVFINTHVTFGQVDSLVELCGFEGDTHHKGKPSDLEPLLNYMIDNKHMYDWWVL